MAALLKCVTCGGMVSEKAEKCPTCGEPEFAYYTQCEACEGKGKILRRAFQTYISCWECHGSGKKPTNLYPQ